MALRASIGQYYSADSPVHRLDPRVKLLGTVVFMVSCFFVSSLPTLLLAALAVGGAVACSHVPARRLLSQIRPIALFLVVTSLINLFFVQSGEVALSMGPLHIHWSGVHAAVLYTARFFLLLLAGSLLTLTTTPVALTDAAEYLLAPLERVGVPVRQGTLVPCALCPRSRRRPSTSWRRKPLAAPIWKTRARSPMRGHAYRSSFRYSPVPFAMPRTWGAPWMHAATPAANERTTT